MAERREFKTHGEVIDYCEKRGRNWKRGTLLSDWKKWKAGKRAGVATTCDHEGTVEPWDCGCSWGCDACDVRFQCSECGAGFQHQKDLPITVTLVLEKPKPSALSNLIEALKILNRYDHQKASYPTHCERGSLMVVAVTHCDVTEHDHKRLNELHFHWNDEYECWCSDFYGSCD